MSMNYKGNYSHYGFDYGFVSEPIFVSSPEEGLDRSCSWLDLFWAIPLLAIITGISWFAISYPSLFSGFLLAMFPWMVGGLFMGFILGKSKD